MVFLYIHISYDSFTFFVSFQMKLFFLQTIIEVLPSKLPTWMWNEESPVNYWLSAMVNSIRHQKITKNHLSPGTCLKILPIPKRHAGLYLKPESLHPSKNNFSAWGTLGSSWEIWRPPLVPTASASLTASSQTCSTLWPPQTSCELLLMVDLSTKLDVSNESNSQFQAHRVTCISRPCDSRNLNLNPLCMLEISPHPKLWTDRVKTITLSTLSLLNIR